MIFDLSALQGHITRERVLMLFNTNCIRNLESILNRGIHLLQYFFHFFSSKLTVAKRQTGT